MIAYLRASTDAQEIASQQIAVEEWIQRDGYDESQIIRVGKEGISACDCKGEYYALFDEMERHIAEGNVKCVYVYCITRLVRMDESRLFNFINGTLAPNGVDLKVMEGGLRLLDDNGMVNPSMEIALKVMAVMAKQQTTELKAQLKRGKDYRRAKGLFAGGKVTFGYCMPDKEKPIEVNPETAPVVERIFKMYVEEQKSTLEIGEQMFKEGVFHRCKTLTTTIQKVHVILRNEQYIGNEFYPMLISTTLFGKAQERLAARTAKPRRSYKDNVYIGKGILYIDSHPMQPRRDVGTYVYNVQGAERCFLNIEITDMLLLQLTDEFLHAPLISDNTAIMEQYTAKIAEYKRMIATSERHIDELIDNKDAVTEKELLGQLSEKRADTVRFKIDEEIEATKKTIAGYESKVKDFENVIGDMENQKVIDVYNLSKKEQAEVVKRCIDRVGLEKVKNGKIKLHVSYKPNVAGTMDDETYIIYSHRHEVTQEYDGLERPVILVGYDYKRKVRRADTTGLLTAEQAKQACKEMIEQAKRA